jgi:hypothetical protein
MAWMKKQAETLEDFKVLESILNESQEEDSDVS